MILIRADANEHIGTGHVMRCLSLARAFVARGEKPLFVNSDHQSDSLLANFNTICLETHWQDLDEEILKLKKIIAEINPSLLIVDSYYVTKSYFHELRKYVRIAYIDDLKTECWDVDYLINYNIYASGLDYSGYANLDTEMIIGPRYAPLREEFKNLHKHKIAKQVTDILVSAGGADPQKITERIIEKVCPLVPDIRFHFVVGMLNPRVEVIKDLANDHIVLHINEKHISTLMRECDIAVSAAGTTLYELCACGTPTITYVLADNQMVAAHQFEMQGIMVNTGDCRNNPEFEDGLVSAILNLNESKRRKLSEKMSKLVDGIGAERIAERLLTRVTVEPCVESDFEDYYSIRCGDSDIFWMGYDGPPARETMKKVFMSRLGENRFEEPGDKRIHMIKADGRNVGFIQFSLSDEGLEFGYSVLDQERGKGYGTVGMKRAVEIARNYRDHCFAHIRDDNIASQKAMMKAGLRPTDEVEMKKYPVTGMVGYRKYVL